MEMKELGEKLREAYLISCDIVSQETPPAFFGSDSIVPEVIHLSQTLFNVWSRSISFTEYTKKGSTYKKKGKTIIHPPEPETDLELSAVVSVLCVIKKDNPKEFGKWEHDFLEDIALKIEKNTLSDPHNKIKKKIMEIWKNTIEKGLTESYHEKWEVET